MAWKDTLLDAKFRGVPFQVQTVGRSGQRAFALHEYPYQAGADLEDLNLRARRVKVKAIFFGDEYEQDLFRLMTALELPGAGELIHPIHGSMMVLAENWDDEHDAEMVDAVVLNMQFVEHSTRELAFTIPTASSKTDAIAVQANAARSAANAATERQLATVSGPIRVTAIKSAFNQAKSGLAKVLKVVGDVKVTLADLEPLLYPQAYFADLASMVDIAFQGLPFGGRNLIFGGADAAAGSGLDDFKKLSGALAPGQLAIGSEAGADAATLADAAVVQAQARCQQATSIAEAAGIILAGELDKPLLDRREIEAMVNTTRAAIQVAINDARSALDAQGRGEASAALGTLAYNVQEAARAVITQRPPLVRRLSPMAGPLRLVAHQMYGDGERALELARLNRLGREVLVADRQELIAYAR
jgi:prophage DNA circulation protein